MTVPTSLGSTKIPTGIAFSEWYHRSRTTALPVLLLPFTPRGTALCVEQTFTTVVSLTQVPNASYGNPDLDDRSIFD